MAAAIAIDLTLDEEVQVVRAKRPCTRSSKAKASNPSAVQTSMGCGQSSLRRPPATLIVSSAETSAPDHSAMGFSNSKLKIDNTEPPTVVDCEVDEVWGCDVCGSDTNLKQVYSLDACNHKVCPECLERHVAQFGPSPGAAVDLTSAGTDRAAPVCPKPECGALLSNRDLALLLSDEQWETYQAAQLDDFRVIINGPRVCGDCGEQVAEEVELPVAEVVAVPDSPPAATKRGGRPRRGAAKGGSGAGPASSAAPAPAALVVAETVPETLQARCDSVKPPEGLQCRQCNAKTCRLCGVATQGGRGGKARSHDCGRSGLYRLVHLLPILDEHWAALSAGPPPEPPPAKKTKKKAAKGPQSAASYYEEQTIAAMAWCGWGGGSKWAKGTGFAGSANDKTGAAGQKSAAEREARADADAKILLDAIAPCLPAPGQTPRDLPAVLAAVRSSALLPLCCRFLVNDSLLDLSRRRAVYLSVFELVLACARNEFLAPLLDRVPRDGPRLPMTSPSLKPKVSASMDVVVVEAVPPPPTKGKGKGRGGAKGKGRAAVVTGGSVAEVVEQPVDGRKDGEKEEIEVLSVVDLLRSISLQAEVFKRSCGAGQGGAEDTANAIEAIAFALQVSDVYDQVKSNVDMTRKIRSALDTARQAVQEAAGPTAGAGGGKKRRLRSDAVEEDHPEVAVEDEKAMAARYVKKMEGERFEVIPLLESVQNGLMSFYYHKELSKGGGGGLNHMVRISQEVSSLATNLPVQADSAVFLRVDEDRFDVMKALITGPRDTPYANGCFEFDIMLPPDYPNHPPKVQFLTTGAGSFRFNPNLYNDGKVCLSLLGTWSGPSWDPKVSTLLQVLISIQSLILVSVPYFNEPGYENSLGTPQGTQASDQYNVNIRAGTMRHAMLSALQHPSPAFADVITAHFSIKKNQILQQLDEWLALSGAPPSKGGKKKKGKTAAAAASAGGSAGGGAPPPQPWFPHTLQRPAPIDVAETVDSLRALLEKLE